MTLNVGANNNTTAFSGNLSGPGSLFKTGTGMLTLATNRTYAGPTTVNGGTLQISTPLGISGLGGNGTGWTLKGSNSPAIGVSGNVLTLTQNGVGSTGDALWYNTPLPLSGTPFTINFTYFDAATGGTEADGIVCLAGARLRA